MGNTKMDPNDFEPHATKAPLPSITVESFRVLYSEEIREAIGDCVSVQQIRLRDLYVSRDGMDVDAAAKRSSETIALARRGQQLIAALHPSPYRW